MRFMYASTRSKAGWMASPAAEVPMATAAAAAAVAEAHGAEAAEAAGAAAAGGVESKVCGASALLWDPSVATACVPPGARGGGIAPPPSVSIGSTASCCARAAASLTAEKSRVNWPGGAPAPGAGRERAAVVDSGVALHGTREYGSKPFDLGGTPPLPLPLPAPAAARGIMPTRALAAAGVGRGRGVAHGARIDGIVGAACVPGRTVVLRHDVVVAPAPAGVAAPAALPDRASSAPKHCLAAAAKPGGSARERRVSASWVILFTVAFQCGTPPRSSEDSSSGTQPP